MGDVSVRKGIGELGALTRVASGGQGIVYTAPGVTMPYASSLVYKEYKPTVLGELDVSVLESMPTYLESLPFTDGIELLSLAAWPCRLVEDRGAVSGFVMPAIPGEFFFDMKKTSGVTRTAGKFQHLLNGDSFLARRQIPLTERLRYELIAATAGALSVFHRHGVAVGDISPNNLLFSLTPTATVFFIDCDGMRFRGDSVLPQVETPDWDVETVNPREEFATPASDSYKLGLLALRLLVGDQSTRDPDRLPATVPGAIRRLISDSLDRNPVKRPAPADWEVPLVAAIGAASTQAPVAPQPVTPKRTPAPPFVVPAASVKPAVAPSPAPRPSPSPAPRKPVQSTNPTFTPAPTSWWQRTSTGAKVGIAVAALAGVAFIGNTFNTNSPDATTQSALPQMPTTTVRISAATETTAATATTDTGPTHLVPRR